MSLWVDKHRPKDLAKLDYHDALTLQLSKVAESGNMPHMLFYGPSGAGKKTRIMALLKGIFGHSVYKLKIEQRSFKTPTKANVDVSAWDSIIFFLPDSFEYDATSSLLIAMNKAAISPLHMVPSPTQTCCSCEPHEF